MHSVRRKKVIAMMIVSKMQCASVGISILNRYCFNTLERDGYFDIGKSMELSRLVYTFFIFFSYCFAPGNLRIGDQISIVLKRFE